MFLMIEGIDGSGKSTVFKDVVAFLSEHGKTIFDLPEWSKKTGGLPTLEDIGSADIIASCEPTRAWIGQGLREEMIHTKSGRAYTTAEIASAFALDRLLLYRRCYIPALKSGKMIVSDRGVATSLVYQAATDPEISGMELAALHGNALALAHAPDHLIIADLDPEHAMERINSRGNQTDSHIFEKIDLLRRFRDGYRSDWFKQLFASRGTTVHYLDTSGSMEETKEKTLALLASIFPAL